MKKLSILLTFILGLTLLFIGCQKMEDIHSEYLRDGDIIYAPKPDSIQTFGGHNRIALKYYLINANNVNKCIIEWDEGANSQTVDITPNTPLDSIQVIINNLDEKSYIFKVYTMDKFGNRSIKVQKPGSAYANKYQSGLSNRSLIGMEGGGTTDSVIVSWGTAPIGNTGVELTYKNNAGEPVTKKVMPEDDYTVIKGWESESEMSYKSFYIPEEMAIDTFASAIETTQLPKFIEFKGVKIANTNWEIVDFSTEEPAEANWGPPIQGQAAAAIDGDLGTFWHTQWDGAEPGYPHYFTVDLKDIVKINKVEVFRRSGDGRGQTRFEIHTSLDGVTFTNQGSFDYDPNSASQAYNINSLPMARYVKYVATAGSNFFAFLAELNIYGQVAAKIDRTNWNIIDMSSEEPAEANWGPPIQGLVAAAIDGDLGTFWHSAWDLSQPPYPHHFTIDMGEAVKLLAVECFRRQGNGNGQTEFKIYTSNDGENFDDQGTFTFNSKINAGQLYPLAFLPEARYFKYVATKGPNHYAFLSEIYMYGQSE